MKPAMYIFLNKGLGMSTGKSAAQASHAAVEALRLSQANDPTRPGNDHWIDTHAVKDWYTGGHYMKLIMECRDSEHIRDTERYLNDRGFKTALILDEGHTEVAHITPTALGVEIVNKDDKHTAATFEGFRLYRDDLVRPIIIESTRRINAETLDRIRTAALSGNYYQAHAIAADNNRRRRFWQR